MVAWRAYRQSSSGRSVWRRKATMIASCSTVSTLDFASFGPVGRSAVDVRFFHFATVFWLIPWRRSRPSGSLDYAVSLDGPPLSLWRSGGVPGP